MNFFLDLWSNSFLPFLYFIRMLKIRNGNNALKNLKILEELSRIARSTLGRLFPLASSTEVYQDRIIFLPKGRKRVLCSFG